MLHGELSLDKFPNGVNSSSSPTSERSIFSRDATTTRLVQCGELGGSAGFSEKSPNRVINTDWVTQWEYGLVSVYKQSVDDSTKDRENNPKIDIKNSVHTLPVYVECCDRLSNIVYLRGRKTLFLINTSVV